MTDEMKACREEFEAFVRRGQFPGENFLKRRLNGRYEMATTHAGWIAYQAAYTARPSLESIVGELEGLRWSLKDEDDILARHVNGMLDRCIDCIRKHFGKEGA